MKTMTAAQLVLMPEYTKFTAVRKEDGSKRRGIVEPKGSLFVYGKGKKRYGQRFGPQGSLSNFDAFDRTYSVSIEEEADKEKAWKKRIKTAKKLLEESGLWQDKIEYLSNLEKITLKEKESIRYLYWEYWKEPYRSDNALYEKLFDPYKEKYPFLFGRGDGGEFFVNIDYLSELSEVQLKTMYFGYGNAEIKREIKAKLDAKEDYVVTGRTGYDVRFRYSAEEGKAWYSEEYRNCGNGHYYLAISESRAWFCEND